MKNSTMVILEALVDLTWNDPYTDFVCAKAHLQNFETCIRNLHWLVFVSQKMHEKFQVLAREILVLLHIRN